MFSKLTDACSSLNCSKHITPSRVMFVALPVAITALVIGLLGLTSILTIPPTIAFAATILGMGLTLVCLLVIADIWRRAYPTS